MAANQNVYDGKGIKISMVTEAIWHKAKSTQSICSTDLYINRVNPKHPIEASIFLLFLLFFSCFMLTTNSFLHDLNANLNMRFLATYVSILSPCLLLQLLFPFMVKGHIIGNRQSFSAVEQLEP